MNTAMGLSIKSFNKECWRNGKVLIWGFVDYENIGSLKDIEFEKYQRLFIFCGPKNPNIKLGNAVITEFIKIEIIKLQTNGANNLDFHIAYYLGKFSQMAQKDVQFHVITKDNGFNGLVNHIKKTGRVCKKIALKVKEESPPPSPVVNLSPCAKLTIERLSHIDGRKRPRKEQQLLNWIESQCQTVGKNINAKSVLGEVVKMGLINKDNPIIKYTLKR